MRVQGPGVRQKVSDDITKWAEEMSKVYKDPPHMSEADQKRAAEIGERMGKCMQEAMGGGSAAPAPKLAITGLDPEKGDPKGGTYVRVIGTAFTAEERRRRSTSVTNRARSSRSRTTPR